MDAAALLNISAAVLTCAAFFGWINARWLKMPLTIGLLVIALTSSMAIMAIDALFNLGYAEQARGLVSQIDFYDSLMIGMLHFLLFAGALHVDLQELLRKRWHVLLMATLGVALSTAIVGVGAWLLLGTLGFDAPFIWCLVFGALISPTDPVAVLSILRSITVPSSLRAKIAGESLFNDGIGVVVFLALLSIATGGDGHGSEAVAEAQHGGFGVADVGKLLFQEVFIGVMIGLVAGWVAFLAMRAIDDYVVEVIITLALVTGVYAVSQAVHASGPLAVVVAGLLIGDHGGRYAMSEVTQDHLEKFWELLDEILNAALFLLLGLEVLIISYSDGVIVAALCAIPLVLLARSAAVTVPISLIRLAGGAVTPGAAPVLIWGGLRGGISVALALSLPDFHGREAILAMTYAVVVFSIIIQGLTVQRLIARVVG